MNANAFGIFLRSTRRKLGLTQVQLGQKVGIAGSSISDLESGRRTPGLKTFKNLEQALGCPIPEGLLESTVTGVSNSQLYSELLSSSLNQENASDLSVIQSIATSNINAEIFNKALKLFRFFLERSQEGYKVYCEKDGNRIEIYLIL